VGFTLPGLLPILRCALTAPFQPYLKFLGGVFSVALSLKSQSLGWKLSSTTFPWSPDFPQISSTIKTQYLQLRDYSSFKNTSLQQNYQDQFINSRRVIVKAIAQYKDLNDR
jgi:hypothetical protein